MSVSGDTAADAPAGALTAVALRFNALGGALAAGPGGEVDPAGVAAIKALVDVERFRRVGIWREEQDWDAYAAYLVRWAGSTGLETTVRRVTEQGPLVFLEIGERIAKADRRIEKNTLMVFEFDAARRIRRLDVYHQCPE
jgi:hypothetical protein